MFYLNLYLFIAVKSNKVFYLLTNTFTPLLCKSGEDNPDLQ